MDLVSLWWNHVGGAARYANDVLGATSTHRVLLLEETPYMPYFLCLLQEKLLQMDASLQFDTSEAEDWNGGGDIGELLMNRFSPSDDYHPLDGSRMAYIARHHLLQGRVLVVRHIEHGPGWLPAAIDYAKNIGTRSGLLILTYGGTCPLPAMRKGVAAPKWNTYLTEYDMQLFASYCIAGRTDLPTSLRHYITQLAARMSGYNPELCNALTNEQMADDPAGFLRHLADKYESVSSLVCNLSTIDLIIWEAQIQTVFPIIERIRRKYIEEYYAGLLSVLPKQDEFGKELLVPEDMELRHMKYYYFNAFGFRSPEEKSDFQMVNDARNKLAHLKILDNQTVRLIAALEARFNA